MQDTIGQHTRVPIVDNELRTITRHDARYLIGRSQVFAFPIFAIKVECKPKLSDRTILRLFLPVPVAAPLRMAV